MNILSDLAEKEKYVALKRRAKDSKEWQKLKRAGSHIPASRQISAMSIKLHESLNLKIVT